MIIAPSETIIQQGNPVGKGVSFFLPMKKVHKKETNALRCELETYKKQGVALWLDGQPSTPKSITKAHMIAEEGAYMRDYIQNDCGEVESIHFDLIQNK